MVVRESRAQTGGASQTAPMGSKERMQDEPKPPLREPRSASQFGLSVRPSVALVCRYVQIIVPPTRNPGSTSCSAMSVS